MYQYLFGPVPSRRLGISLGVDLVPMKTCSLNCIYCECGRTTALTLTRREYVPLDMVKSEFSHYIEHHPVPDYITFSGSGEPTLHSGIGEAIRFIQSYKLEIPVAVLTNGTLLFEEKTRNELKKAAVVIPSLDAVSGDLFKKINRPFPRLQIDRMIEGLIRFREIYTGQLWLEIFIVPGLNDTDAELTLLKKTIGRIQPDRVQLNTLDRPGPVSDIRAATRKELQRIIDFWQLPQAEIIAKTKERTSVVSYRQDVESAILETIARRPCTLEDLTKILGLHTNEVNKY
ncbi:MAG: radical SAM protein, partial [Deltaproteobacteria bacterium]|nr:radical SAM protein [Deltaproteobacteria bacterium]